MPKPFRNIMLTLILTASGGTLFFSGLLSDKNECEATRTELLQELNEKSLSPIRGIQLMGINEYGCGVLSSDISEANQLKISNLRTDGDVFVFYSDADYQIRMETLLNKRKNRKKGEPDYDSLEEFYETIAILNHAIKGSVKIDGPELNKIDKKIAEKLMKK